MSKSCVYRKYNTKKHRLRQGNQKKELNPDIMTYLEPSIEHLRWKFLSKEVKDAVSGLRKF